MPFADVTIALSAIRPLRLLAGLASVVFALIVMQGQAVAQSAPSAGNLHEWRALLQHWSCANPRGYDEWNQDEVIAAALGFGQISVAEVSDRAGLNLLDYVLNGRTVEYATDSETVSDLILLAATGSYETATALARHPAFCAYARLLAGESLQELAQGQQDRAGHYGPDQRFAQRLLDLHGCAAGAADGVFGPNSREAWNRAVLPADPALALRDNEFPSATDVLALMGLASEHRACRLTATTPAQAAGSTAVALAFLDLAAGCAGDGDLTIGTELGRPLAAAAVADPDNLRALADSIVAVCAHRDGSDLMRLVADLSLAAGRAQRDSPQDAALVTMQVMETMNSLPALAAVQDYRDTYAGAGDTIAYRIEWLLEEPDTAELAAEIAILLVAAEKEYGPFWYLPELAGDMLRREDLPGKTRDRLREALGKSDLSLAVPGLLAQRVDAAIAGEEDAGALAEALGGQLGMLISVNWNGYDPEALIEDGAGSYHGMLRVEATTTFAGIGPLMNLARLLGHHPEAGEGLIRTGSGPANFMLAAVLLEGYSGQPRNEDLLRLARGLMQAAADDGFGMAQLRLAQMLDAGLGGPADPEAAGTYYKAAAEAGQPEAFLALARRAEADSRDAEAIDFYARAYGIRGGKMPDSDDVIALTALVRRGEGIFGTPAGRDLETEMQRRFVDIGWGALMAHEIAMGLMSRNTGQTADPARAADWLRLGISADRERAESGSQEGGEARVYEHVPLLLARLLTVMPELAERPMPAGLPSVESDPAALVAGLSAEGLLSGKGSGPGAAPWENCPDARATEIETCVDAALTAAVGGYGSSPIGAALEWLEARAAEEADDVRLNGRLTGGEFDTYYPRQPFASAGLATALAWWGDWPGAQAAAQPFPALPFDWLDSPRQDQFRRITARWIEGRAPTVWPGFLATVTAFAARGDDTSAEILALVRAVESEGHTGPAAQTDIAAAREGFALAEPLGTGSSGMARAARRLAPLEAAAGNRTRAVELELMALNADLERATVDAILHGPIPGDMTRICGWSHASERFLAMGETDLAVILAELAVNRLQALRGALTAVPENLQLCFRDQVTDHYRWLAGLYMDAGRPADADRVLMLLKDFETFRFISRDRDFTARATAVLAPPGDAEVFSDVIAPIRPTVTGQSIRRRELLLMKKSAALTETQEAELAGLNDSLSIEAASRESAVAAIVDEAVAMGRTATAGALEDGKTIKRRLREMGSRAAALQYVVLDQRLGIILTTPVSQRVFFQTEMDGAALSTENLLAKITEFRATLSDPSQDPLPLAAMFSDFLLPADLRAELAAAGTDRLVLSPDGPLRYIPFAALHDGQRWLVQDYILTHATGGAMAGPGTSIVELAGFGVSKSLHGLAALPGVARELREISGPGGAALPASVWMDGEFNRDSLSAALIFGDGFSEELGVLHLASHFKLGRTEADSFLLMGDGTLLSVADLRDGLGADLDFSEIGLLTLSACETGYGGAGDGAELESFAAVAQDAGARSVAATLWPVNDRSISLLMQDFYRGAFPKDGDTGDLPLALALAQRDMIGRSDGLWDPDRRGAVDLPPENGSAAGARVWPGHTHPFHWAPLVLLEGAG